MSAVCFLYNTVSFYAGYVFMIRNARMQNKVLFYDQHFSSFLEFILLLETYYQSRANQTENQ